MMDKQALAQEIYQISNICGEFTLRSGNKATEYFDKYLFEAQPKILSNIAQQLAFLIPKDIDALAGLEMGGIPIATALSLQTNIPTMFVRKQAKTYGTCKLAEGGEVKEKHLLIIEDVVTSGGAIIEAVKQLRTLGAIITKAVCVIDRESSGKNNLASIGVELVPLFTKSQLESAKLDNVMTKNCQITRRLIEEVDKSAILQVFSKTTSIHHLIQAAREGKNPIVICKMPSYWIVFSDRQFILDYTLLLSDPVVGDLNELK